MHRSLHHHRVLGSLVLALFILSVGGFAAQAAAADPFKAWPPRAFLIKSLVKSVDETLKTYHPETGRFGTEPWVCGDQNVILPLAAAWSIKDPANPYYHDKKLLAVIGKGGEALVDDQDEDGKWIFHKKDISTWGMIYMPWTYSRWIRAYLLVRDALPKAQRDKWEKGLLLGFAGIRQGRARRGSTTSPAITPWRSTSPASPSRTRSGRRRPGTSSTRSWPSRRPRATGPRTSARSSATTWSTSRPWGSTTIFPRTRPSSRPSTGAVKFHAGVLWSDGTSASSIDERVIYHKGVNTGNVGFSYSPEGRGFILSQLAKQPGRRPARRRRRLRRPDAPLRRPGAGSCPLPSEQAKGVSVLGENDAVIVRDKPWEWAFSAYTTASPRTAGSRTATTTSTSSTPSWAWSPAAGTPSSSPTGPPSPSATRASSGTWRARRSRTSSPRSP